jgi:hypothetical protein
LNFAIFVTYLIYDIKLKIQKEYIDDTWITYKS